MSLKWFCGFALLLSVALPVTALAESENGERRLRPNSSVVNIFGWGKNQKAIMRQVDVREYDPETSISGEADPSPSQRLIPIPATEGNLTYIPEKLEPLRDRKLKEQRPADLYAAALFDELQSDNPAASVLAAERKVILDHYRDTAFKPLWTTPAGISERGREVLALFKGAPDEGLDTADYELRVLGGFDAPPNSFANDPVHLARLDIELTARAMAYARHASGGRLIPDRLTTYNDIAAPRIDPAEAMRMLAVTPFAASWLKSLHPTHPAYAAFKTELANLRKLAADTAQMPILPGKRLKLGQSDDRLPILRQHLQRLGHLKSETPDLSVLPHHIQEHARSAASIGLTFMDVDVSNALKAFQKAHNLKQSAILDQLTIRALNNQSPARNIAGLTANMERLRWLPRELGKRHVFVNQAAFEVRVMDGQREVWRSNVVVGKTDAQTSAFHDVMESVVFNPSWGVPPSIVSNEMLPILWRDPTYLDRKGFTVVNKSGKRVASSDVNWAAYGANAPYSIMQPPGEDNALGEVKFLFPNRHHIYMHDTPSRQLFSRPVRAFSHGCVRVQNPRRFAEIVLGLSPAEVARRIDSGRSQTVRIKDKIPVHLTYFTAWPDASGRIEYIADVYGRDLSIENAFGLKRLALR